MDIQEGKSSSDQLSSFCAHICMSGLGWQVIIRANFYLTFHQDVCKYCITTPIAKRKKLQIPKNASLLLIKSKLLSSVKETKLLAKQQINNSLKEADICIITTHSMF